jgi:alkanesulfonate monooxygenase SsuD/methylene tetrahydromethanopterin reductase-like flavin-dependent oxidoreductase (luciferase family)
MTDTEFMAVPFARPDHSYLAEMAEDLGYTHFGVGEGPLVFGDPYVTLSQVAERTNEIKLGPMVTNPITRTPVQTANALATLNKISPGRVYCGLGTGNNALRSQGLRPAYMREYKQAINIIQGLTSGERMTYEFEGTEYEEEFLNEHGLFYNPDERVPVYAATGGPKSIEIAAKHADVIMHAYGGNCPEMLKLIRELIDDAAREAGRAPDEIQLWSWIWFYQTRRGEGRKEAIKNGFGTGPINSAITEAPLMQQYSDRFDNELIEDAVAARDALVDDSPEEPEPKSAHLEAWRGYGKGYQAEAETLVPLMTERLLDALSIYGTPKECLEKTKAMVENGDLDGICLGAGNTLTSARDINDFAQTVINEW